MTGAYPGFFGENFFSNNDLIYKLGFVFKKIGGFLTLNPMDTLLPTGE